MSIFKIFSPPKKRKPQRKTPPKEQTRVRSAPKSNAPEPRRRQPSLWERLSTERKLDVIGVGLSVAGLLILLTLFASSRSILTADFIRLFSQLLGWGIYVLPLGLLVLGIWLILRRSERLPVLSLERVAGIALLYIWLLTIMHSIIAQPIMADAAARDGAGGGYIGGLFERLLWFGLGAPGAVIALMAWLLIALTMTLDMTILDLFSWTVPWIMRLQRLWKKPLSPAEISPAGAQSN